MYCSGCVFGVLALRSRHSCDLEHDRTQKKASFKPNARSSSVASGVRNQGHRTCVPGGLPVSPEVLFHPVFPTGPPSQKDGARQADGPGLGRPWPIGPRITGLMPSRPPGGAGAVSCCARGVGFYRDDPGLASTAPPAHPWVSPRGFLILCSSSMGHRSPVCLPLGGS